jgi:hypothetical protein
VMRVPLELVPAVEGMIAGLGVEAVGTASVVTGLGHASESEGAHTPQAPPQGFESPAPATSSDRVEGEDILPLGSVTGPAAGADAVGPDAFTQAKLEIARAALGSIGAGHTEKKLPPFEARAAKQKALPQGRTNEFGDDDFGDYEF